MQKIFLALVAWAVSLSGQPAPSSVIIIEHTGPPAPPGIPGPPGGTAPIITNLQTSIDQIPPTGSLHIPAAAYTVTNYLQINNRHVCDPAASISSPNGPTLLISGSTEITIDGCGLTPQPGSYALRISNSMGIHIRHNSIKGKTRRTRFKLGSKDRPQMFAQAPLDYGGHRE